MFVLRGDKYVKLSVHILSDIFPNGKVDDLVLKIVSSYCDSMYAVYSNSWLANLYKNKYIRLGKNVCQSKTLMFIL